jgi:SAM-dependent methyltransferase
MTKSIFTKIYQQNGWTSKESVSGPGSTLHQTSNIRLELPILLNNYSVQSVLDIPCGDFNWWPHTTFISDFTYIGADIVPELVTQNQKRFPKGDFRVLDIINDKLPKVDMIFTRDCLGHLSNANVEKALANIKASGSKYLMATSFFNPHWKTDADIPDGGWRPINLAVQFKLGEPILYIDEKLYEAEGAYRDKSLGLWRIN